MVEKVHMIEDVHQDAHFNVIVPEIGNRRASVNNRLRLSIRGTGDAHWSAVERRKQYGEVTAV